MTRLKFVFSLLLTSLLSTACKKEKLEASAVEKLESNTTDRLNKVAFINNVGYAVGGQRFSTATVLLSYDGGNTWVAKSFPEAGKGIYGITQKYDNLGVFTIGFDSKMLSTTDDGNTWNYRLLNTWKPFKDLAFIEPQTCIMVGGISFTTGWRAYVNDAGETYIMDSLNYELNDIEMVNNKTGYICGFGVVEKTNDGAVSWQQSDIHNENFMAMHLKNADELWVCGYNGSIYHTTNGGQNWDKQRNGNNATLPKYHLLDIFFKDDNNGWAVGEEGVFIHTTNGGKDWQAYEKFTKDALRSIAMAPDGNLIICGDNGGMFRITVN